MIGLSQSGLGILWPCLLLATTGVDAAVLRIGVFIERSGGWHAGDILTTGYALGKEVRLATRPSRRKHELTPFLRSPM